MQRYEQGNLFLSVHCEKNLSNFQFAHQIILYRQKKKQIKFAHLNKLTTHNMMTIEFLKFSYCPKTEITSGSTSLLLFRVTFQFLKAWRTFLFCLPVIQKALFSFVQLLFTEIFIIVRTKKTRDSYKRMNF